MKFDLQPSIHNDLIRIEPLGKGDFEVLYAVASDPLVWEQHPNKDRYKREVFENFFKGAIESGGAFLRDRQQQRRTDRQFPVLRPRRGQAPDRHRLHLHRAQPLGRSTTTAR